MNYHFFKYLQTLARHISLFLLVQYLTSSYLMLLLYLTSYLSIKYDLILNAITVKAKSPSENGCLNASLGRIKFCRSSSSYFLCQNRILKYFFSKFWKNCSMAFQLLLLLLPIIELIFFSQFSSEREKQFKIAFALLMLPFTWVTFLSWNNYYNVCVIISKTFESSVFKAPLPT